MEKMKSFYVGLAALVERNERFLVLKRSADKDFASNSWEPVTGRLEEKENSREGVMSGIREETRIKAQVIMHVETSLFCSCGKAFPVTSTAFWCKYVEGDD